MFGYNAATERLEIPLIRVRKADGTLVETPSTSIQDLSSPVERIAPVYTDFRQKHATVQSFRPGARSRSARSRPSTPPWRPASSGASTTFEETAIVLDEQLDIDVPAARQLILKLRPGFDPVVKEAGGRRTYHWARSHAVRKEKAEPAGKEEEADLDDMSERLPIRLTTFADWKELGAWFAGLERAARKVTPEIQEKARTLTAGRASDAEKLEALYDFVSKNFRYVSLSLGAGRYQPRAAADVLRDAYGDCKDKHTLLATLIDAAGLQASGVLINSRAKIDPDFPSPSQFDHVYHSRPCRRAGRLARCHAGGRAVSAPVGTPAEEAGARHAGGPGVAAGGNAGRPAMASLLATDVDGALDEAGTLKANVQVRLAATKSWPRARCSGPRRMHSGRDCWSRWRPMAA